jgi:hypothetical protein
MKNSGLAALALLLGAGCSQQLIPNTDIEDTDFNRSLVEFCEKYRHAVEHRNINTLLTMADPQYYEDGGNADATDDLDYAGLKGYLEAKFVNARAIRYEIRYREVSKNERSGWNVAYTYSASYQLPDDGNGLVWHREVADNQLELVPAGESYKILSGM